MIWFRVLEKSPAAARDLFPVPAAVQPCSGLLAHLASCSGLTFSLLLDELLLHPGVYAVARVTFQNHTSYPVT